MDDIDDRYIWQRRIAHGIRYQKGVVPFPESVKIGLDFNAALERTEKLDRSLLTNGVMLEICDFAKTVTKSEKYFLFEMLDFNFDLGVDTGNDQLRYAYLSRVHCKIKQLKEQIKTKPGRWREVFVLPDPNVLSADSEVSTVYCPKWNKMVDSSLLTDGSSSSQPVASGGRCVSKSRMKRGGNAFRLCTELGVSPAVRPSQTPRQKLDRNLLTNGVMLELLHFSRVLCGTHMQIVYELVRQNFGLEPDKLLFRLTLSKLMERKQLPGEDRDALRRELFQILTVTKHRKRKPRDTDLGAGDGQDGDLSYMCPMDFETEDHPAETPDVNHITQHIKQEEEQVFVSPQVNGHDACLLTGQQNGDGPETFCGHDTDAYRRKLWQRRTAHNILTADCADTTFSRCRRIGLDFDVSSGTKQKLDLHLLTNGVVQELYMFANAVSRSTRSFLFDILHNNFQLSLQDAQHERDFIFSILIKEKFLQSHPDRHSAAFLSMPLQSSETYVPVKQEETPQDESGRADVEAHPHCRRLGLDLWSTEERPASQKLELTALSVGAMLEMVAFVRELCGTACDTVCDILEHNFDLDLQSGKTEAAQVIRQWYVGKKKTNRMKGWSDTPVPLNGQTQPSPPVRSRVTRPVRKTKALITGQLDDQLSSYPLCRQIGLNLNIHSRSGAKQKLDLGVLTRAVLLEVHRYVRKSSSHYVPALYGILEHNFDLTSQKHRKVEFAWTVASQVITMAAKSDRKAAYQNAVFQLPFEEPATVCKDEPGDGVSEPEDLTDVEFVRQLKPVDIMVEVD